MGEVSPQRRGDTSRRAERTPREEASLPQLVMRVARTLRRANALGLEPFGLSPHQGRALGVVARHGHDGALRLSDLAEHLGIAPRSATEVVDALEERGLVQRSPSPTDRRAIVIDLTEAGAKLRDDIEQVRAERGDEFFAGLTASEQKALADLLRRALAAAESGTQQS